MSENRNKNKKEDRHVCVERSECYQDTSDNGLTKKTSIARCFVVLGLHLGIDDEEEDEGDNYIKRPRRGVQQSLQMTKLPESWCILLL
jgi:hypothetical protein